MRDELSDLERRWREAHICGDAETVLAAFNLDWISGAKTA